MPHITEGELHAYLDGALIATEKAAVERLTAHLAVCADCSARLEEAREVRDRAGELMRIALPTVEAPPFEEIVAAAGGTSSSRSRGTVRRDGPGSRGDRLAWAASLLLALGAGWMGHALLRVQTAPIEMARTLQSVGAVEDSPRSLELREEIAPAAGSARLADDASLNESDVQTESTAGRRNEARASSAVEKTEVDANRPAANRRAVEPPAEPPAEVAPEKAASQFRLDQVEVFDISALFADDIVDESDWAVASIGEASEWLGRAPLSVRGLPIMAIVIGGTDSNRLVRVDQELPGGEILALTQIGRPPDGEAVAGGRVAAADDAPVAGLTADADEKDARTRQTGQQVASQAAAGQAKSLIDQQVLYGSVGNVLIRLRARLASDSLAVLLSRIR